MHAGPATVDFTTHLFHAMPMMSAWDWVGLAPGAMGFSRLLMSQMKMSLLDPPAQPRRLYTFTRLSLPIRPRHTCCYEVGLECVKVQAPHRSDVLGRLPDQCALASAVADILPHVSALLGKLGR